MTQPMYDERVEQETAQIMTKNFWTGAIVLAALLVVKIIMAVRGTAWVCVLPEVTILATGFASLLIQWTKRGLWGPKDERTQAESAKVLYSAWQHMVGAFEVIILAMLLLDVDKDAYVLTLLFNVVTFILQERRLVKAGVYHQQIEPITKKNVLKTSVFVGVFGVAVVAIGCLLKGEMAPWWVLVLSAVLFMLLGAITAGVTWVQEIVSEQNADKEVMAAEEADEE